MFLACPHKDLPANYSSYASQRNPSNSDASGANSLILFPQGRRIDRATPMSDLKMKTRPMCPTMGTYLSNFGTLRHTIAHSDLKSIDTFVRRFKSIAVTNIYSVGAVADLLHLADDASA